MIRTRFGTAGAAMLLLGLCGCQTAPLDASGDIERVSASSAIDEAVMGRLVTLEGRWRMLDESGEPMPDEDGRFAGSVFQVTSAGSAVREIMFPGSDHEMTNLYHMDGDSAVCTHYCAAGNQPTMVAHGVELTDEGAKLAFHVLRVSNFRDGQDTYMGGLRLTLVDENTLRQEWTGFDAAGEVAHTMVFNLRREPDAL